MNPSKFNFNGCKTEDGRVKFVKEPRKLVFAVGLYVAQSALLIYSVCIYSERSTGFFLNKRTIHRKMAKQLLLGGCFDKKTHYLSSVEKTKEIKEHLTTNNSDKNISDQSEKFAVLVQLISSLIRILRSSYRSKIILRSEIKVLSVEFQVKLILRYEYYPISYQCFFGYFISSN